jgi:hypothetical protein
MCNRTSLHRGELHPKPAVTALRHPLLDKLCAGSSVVRTTNTPQSTSPQQSELAAQIGEFAAGNFLHGCIEQSGQPFILLIG